MRLFVDNLLDSRLHGNDEIEAKAALPSFLPFFRHSCGSRNPEAVAMETGNLQGLDSRLHGNDGKNGNDGK